MLFFFAILSLIVGLAVSGMRQDFIDGYLPPEYEDDELSQSESLEN